MIKTAVVTDTNSGITKAEAQDHSIQLISMPFIIDEKQYFENVNLTHEQFYTMLDQGAAVSTSQPSPGEVTDCWEKLLKNFESIVYIPMSSGLSSSCHTSMMLAEDYDGKVQVVDNHRISVTMKQSVYDAVRLAQEGKHAVEIKKILEEQAFDASIYITVDTLSYLKKGGRVTAAGAAIGSVLNIKPVLTIQGDKLDAFEKVRGMKAARRSMIRAMQNDLQTRLKPLKDREELQMFISYSFVDEETLKDWKEEVEEAFPEMDILADPLTLSVGCHIGPGALAIAVCRK